MKLCGFDVGLDRPLFLIAGPCVIESQQMALDTAGQLQEICRELNLPFIYKSSYDKANRSSGKSFRGFGLDATCMASTRSSRSRRSWTCCKPRHSCAARPTSSRLWRARASR